MQAGRLGLCQDTGLQIRQQRPQRGSDAARAPAPAHYVYERGPEGSGRCKPGQRDPSRRHAVLQDHGRGPGRRKRGQ